MRSSTTLSIWPAEAASSAQPVRADLERQERHGLVASEDAVRLAPQPAGDLGLDRRDVRALTGDRQVPLELPLRDMPAAPVA